MNIVGVVGDDFDMARYDFLKERGVNLNGIEVVEGRTFRWSGRYHENMNDRDTLSTELGVFEDFNPKLAKEAAEAEYLLLANIHPDLQLKVMEQVKNTKLVVFDTMNFWIDSCRHEVNEMLRKVDIVTVNEEEIRLLTDERSPLAGAKKILKMGPKYVIVKKGEHGAIVVGNDVPTFLCPAYPIENAIDPTGAGDTFAGAMLGYLAATNDLGFMNLRRAVVYGTVAASFTCEAFSVLRLAQININDLDERLRKFQEMVEF